MSNQKSNPSQNNLDKVLEMSDVIIKEYIKKFLKKTRYLGAEYGENADFHNLNNDRIKYFDF